MLTQEYLKSILNYNPDTGEFTYLNPKRSRTGKVGTVSLGYLRISIDSKLYLAHRLAFLYMEGVLPPNSVDHMNGNRSDNRWSNLRKCTQQQNVFNSTGSGIYYKNVYFTKGGRNKPFNVKIEINGVSRSFGYYRTPEEADEVASLIRDMLHGDYSVSNRTKETHGR